MSTRVVFRTLILLALVVGGTASAGDAEEQKVLVKAQRMLRQMSRERDAALADNARLKNGLEEMKGMLGGVKKSSEAALAKSRDSDERQPAVDHPKAAPGRIRKGTVAGHDKWAGGADPIM